MNPLLQDWTAPFGLPPFGDIGTEHFRPAFEAALREGRANIDAIAGRPGRPDLRQHHRGDGARPARPRPGGRRLLQPRRRPHQRRDRGAAARPEPEARRPPRRDDDEPGALRPGRRPAGPAGGARAHPRAGPGARRSTTGCSSAPAPGSPARSAARLKEVLQRLASLGTAFGQNVLADEQAWTLALGPDDLAGLPDDLVAAAAAAAAERGLDGPRGDALAQPRRALPPVLAPPRPARAGLPRLGGARRERRRARQPRRGGRDAGAARGAGAAPRLSRLRLLQARARDGEDAAGGARPPDGGLGPGAGARRRRRRAARGADARRRHQRRRSSPGTGATTPPSARRASTTSTRRRSSPTCRSTASLPARSTSPGGSSASASTPIEVPLYHPDARAWEVRKGDRHMGVFIGDYFARASKRSGAWCSSFRGQSRLDGEVRPIVVNVCNFAKAPKGEPTLLTFDDAHTLFHELGHALHGLLSDVTYEFVSGTSRRARLRRAAEPALRALAGDAGGARGARPPRRDRRADAARADGTGDRRAQLRPGLRHGRVSRLGARRPRLPRRPGARRPDGGAGGDARAARDAARNRHATRHAALPARLRRRRLLVRVLFLHVVRGDGRRRLRRLPRDGRRLRPGARRSGSPTAS